MNIRMCSFTFEPCFVVKLLMVCYYIDMNIEMWNVTELPEENRLLLLYDTMNGLKIGYFSADLRMFYSLEDVPLRDVSAWLYVPNKPNTYARVLDTVRNKNYIDTRKKSGGTKDV